MSKKSVFLISCLLSNQLSAESSLNQKKQEDIILKDVARRADIVLNDVSNPSKGIEASCLLQPETIDSSAAYCPSMLIDQIKDDKEYGIINGSVASKCRATKESLSYTAERYQEFYRNSKSTALGAPQGNLVGTCLGASSGLNYAEKTAVVAEYTLLRNRAAYGAKSLVQELYDIEGIIPPSYSGYGPKSSWDKYAYGDEKVTLKRLTSGYSATPGMNDLMKEREACNNSVNLAENRFKLKELRFKQSYETLAQVSMLNDEIFKINSKQFSEATYVGTGAGYGSVNIIPLSKEDLQSLSQLKAMKETLLENRPWLKTKPFQSFLSRKDLHRKDSSGDASLDQKGEIAWDIKKKDIEKINLAFHEQAKYRRKVVLEELSDIEHASGCINGSNKSCDYKDVMKKLQSTPKLAEESNVLRMDVVEKSGGNNFNPETLDLYAMSLMDTASSCRQEFRDIHSENNKIAKNFAIDVGITLATAGVGGYLAASARAGATATTTAVKAVTIGQKLARLVSIAKHPGVAMRALTASKAIEGLIKAANLGRNINGLINAINQCDSKIVPKLEKLSQTSLSCDSFDEQNMEAEHTGCLASVALSLGGFLPQVINPALKKIAKQTEYGETIVKGLEQLSKDAKTSQKAYDTLKIIKGTDKLVEMWFGPKKKLKKLLVSPLEDKKKDELDDSTRNVGALQFIMGKSEKEKMAYSYILIGADEDLEGLTEKEKEMVTGYALEFQKQHMGSAD